VFCRICTNIGNILGRLLNIDTEFYAVLELAKGRGGGAGR